MNSLVVVTDGRYEYLAQCLGSINQHLDLDWFRRKLIIDDSGTGNLIWDLPTGWNVWTRTPRQGLARTVADAWGAVAGSEFVLHVEEDFVFTEQVDLPSMARILRERPYLAEMTLKRQAWGPERAGYMEDHPERYTECRDGPLAWCEHRECFSLNPSLIRGEVIFDGFEGGEAEQTERLTKNEETRFGVWGKKLDPPRVTHVGDRRSEDWLP